MTQHRSPEDLTAEKLPERLPILPLHETALYPKMVLPLVVMQGDSIKLVDEAMQKDRIIGMLVAKADAPAAGDQAAEETASENEAEETAFDPREHLSAIGTSAMIMKMAKTQDNQTQMLVQGISRFRVKDFVQEKPYLIATVEHLKEQKAEGKEVEALMTNLVNTFGRVVELSPGMPAEIAAMAKAIQEPGTLANMVASTLNVDAQKKQAILERDDVKKRLRAVVPDGQPSAGDPGTGQQDPVPGQGRHGLSASGNTICASSSRPSRKNWVKPTKPMWSWKNTAPRSRSATCPKRRERKRNGNSIAWRKMHPSSAEYTVASTYLDWLTALPWNEEHRRQSGHQKARKVLDEDHFGLEKAKRRIIEYLAVRKLKPGFQRPDSVLRRASGHRQNLPGAFHRPGPGAQILPHLPGRGARRSRNPRPSAHLCGRPARPDHPGHPPGRVQQSRCSCWMKSTKWAAISGAIPPRPCWKSWTPSRISLFPIIIWMCPSTCPRSCSSPRPTCWTPFPALRDRMEVLELLGYTEDEKIKIANRFLIPRQREAHGLKAKPDQAYHRRRRKIIAGYTREAGLRNLEREIATICRGVAAKIAEGDDEGRDHQDGEICRIPGAGQDYLGSQGAHGHPGRCHRAGLDPRRRRDSVHRGHRHEGAKGLDPYRAAGGCDERIGHRGLELYPFPCQGAENRRGFFRAARPPYPRTGRRHSQGRPLGRGHHADGPGLAVDQHDGSKRIWP